MILARIASRLIQNLNPALHLYRGRFRLWFEPQRRGAINVIALWPGAGDGGTACPRRADLSRNRIWAAVFNEIWPWVAKFCPSGMTRIRRSGKLYRFVHPPLYSRGFWSFCMIRPDFIRHGVLDTAGKVPLRAPARHHEGAPGMKSGFIN